MAIGPERYARARVRGYCPLLFRRLCMVRLAFLASGGQACDRHGIYAASRALRHASVAVTAAHYVDKKSKVTSGLGAVLSDKLIELDGALADVKSVEGPGT
jgi:hypothetical protein